MNFPSLTFVVKNTIIYFRTTMPNGIFSALLETTDVRVANMTLFGETFIPELTSYMAFYRVCSSLIIIVKI